MSIVINCNMDSVEQTDNSQTHILSTLTDIILDNV